MTRTTMYRLVTEEHLELVRDQLRAQAEMFDDPATYEAGVSDALAALRATVGISEDERELADALPRMI